MGFQTVQWLMVGGLFISVTLSPGAAAAQPQGSHTPPQGAHACGSDVQKFCSGTTPGGGRIIQCLKSHQSELSSDCQEELKNAPPPGSGPRQGQGNGPGQQGGGFGGGRPGMGRGGR